MERPTTHAPIPPLRDEAQVAIAREAFAAWLRAERETRGIPLQEIARVTKIQIRALELLEDAAFDELPADVFVRGFIRNYARVVGLDAAQALQRYDDCGVTPGPAAAARARAMIETVGAMAPRALATSRRTAQGTPSSGTVRPLAAGSLTMPAAQVMPEPVVEIAPAPIVVEASLVVEAAPEEPKKPARAKKQRGGKRRSKKVTAEAAPVIEPIADLLEPEVDDFEMTIIEEPPEVVAAPAPAPVVMVTPPRPYRPRVTQPTPIPSLVIDDDDPDSAERTQAARELDEKLAKDKAGRGFLPQSLLDGDRGTRQGGLTLAVIILLIVATLTLSYLMRRPSSSGEGVTALPDRDHPLAGRLAHRLPVA
jgi:cytoskeletal protein RodZ